METRSNRLVVGLVMGVLIAAAIGFALWLRPERDEEGLTYQIRFELNGEQIEVPGGLEDLTTMTTSAQVTVPVVEILPPRAPGRRVADRLLGRSSRGRVVS